MNRSSVGRTSRRRRLGSADVRMAVIAAGGVAGYGELVAASSKRAVEHALRAGDLVRVARGFYSLPAAPEVTAGGGPAGRHVLDTSARSSERAERAYAHRRIARSHAAVLSHRSAAEYHQLPLLKDPDRPEVIVIRGRRATRELRAQADVRYRSLLPDEHQDCVTTPARTVLDCAADLPFPEALAVADSALRSTDDHAPLAPREELLLGVDAMATQVRPQVRRLIALADGRAANPFESGLRAIALQVEGANFIPQYPIASFDATHTVDLADKELRLALEADSYTWHGNRAGFERDCRRYTCLTVDGWMVLRFTWSMIMSSPDWVRAVIEAAVAHARGRLACPRCLHIVA